MKIYFTGSVKGGRENQREFEYIIKELKKYGEVLSEHIGDDKISHYGETNILSKSILQREKKRIKDSDIIIAEVTTPSLGVGFLICYGLELKKKVIVLYKGKNTLKLSSIITGSQEIEVHIYQKKDDIIFLASTLFQKYL